VRVCENKGHLLDKRPEFEQFVSPPDQRMHGFDFSCLDLSHPSRYLTFCSSLGRTGTISRHESGQIQTSMLLAGNVMEGDCNTYHVEIRHNEDRPAPCKVYTCAVLDYCSGLVCTEATFPPGKIFFSITTSSKEVKDKLSSCLHHLQSKTDFNKTKNNAKLAERFARWFFKK